jgi:hypothetical protein
MSARLLDDTPRALGVRMNYRDQLARRFGSRAIKNKPTTAPTPDLLKPQRPAPARRRAISPTVTRHRGKTPRHYRQTARPAPMPQRIKPRTRETVYPTSHGTPPRARTSNKPNTRTRSQRHQPTTNTNRHRRTQPTRRPSAILPAVQQERHTAHRPSRQTNTARRTRTRTQFTTPSRRPPTIRAHNMRRHANRIARPFTCRRAFNRSNHGSNRHGTRPKFYRVRLIIGKHGKRQTKFVTRPRHLRDVLRIRRQHDPQVVGSR